MCATSFVADHYRDRWQDRLPQIHQWQFPAIVSPPISREEFDTLKREVSEMKDLLKRAKKYDADTGQPDCEMDEKMAVLRKVAKLVGVDLDAALTP